MKFLFCFFIIILFGLSNAVAQSSIDDVKKFLEAIKLEEMLIQMKQIQKEMSEQQAQTMLNQIKDSMPEYSDSVIYLLKAPIQQYVETISESWDPKVASEIYANSLSKILTEEELNKAVKYYQTDKGKKELIAITEAINNLNNYIQNQINLASVKANQDLINEIKKIRQQLKIK